MNKLLKSAIIVLIISVIGGIWGYTYTQNNSSHYWARGFGYSDPTYTVAEYSIIGGAMGFLVGIGLLIGGLVQQKNQIVSPRRNYIIDSSVKKITFCSNCGSAITPEAEFCQECGKKI